MATAQVMYQDAVYSGYKLDIGLIGTNPYSDYPMWDKSVFPDAKIFRPHTNVDNQLLYNKALITVNGLIHSTELFNNELWIRNCTKTMLRSNNNHVGIISFSRNTPNLIKYPIEASFCSADIGLSLYQKVFITFPNEIKMPLLIIGGYMQFEEPGIFYRISPNSFALSINRLNYIDRLYETYQYRDIYHDLELTINPILPDLVDYDDATSDETIIKYLTLDNTFIVDLNVDSVSLDKIYLRHSTLPGSYIVEEEPTLPVISRNGKVVEYWKKFYNNKYILRTSDSYYNNLLFSRLTDDDIRVINMNRDVRSTYRLNGSYFLSITCTF